MNLFDQLIKPIALYGSEIWGPDVIKGLDGDDTKYCRSLESFACEKLNLSFARFVLGVHKKAQNSAIYGELGRYPLGIDITANILLYHEHLLSENASPLMHNTLLVSNSNNKSWGHTTLRIKSNIVGNQHFLALKTRSIKRKLIKKHLASKYRTYWCNKITAERKMRTYIKFKDNLVLESYLETLPAEHRKTLARFRMSAHHLAIERGRYTKPPTPVENRTCPHCPSQIEDEFHFLMKCTELKNDREILLKNIGELCPQVLLLPDHLQFVYLMSAAGEIIKFVAAFIHKNIK